jgi:hypothetical protein
MRRLRDQLSHLRPQHPSPTNPGSDNSRSNAPTITHQRRSEGSQQNVASQVRWPFSATGSPGSDSDDEDDHATTTERGYRFAHAVDMTPTDRPVELGRAPTMSVRERGTWARPPRAHARRRSRECRTGRATPIPIGMGEIRRYTPVSGRIVTNVSPVVLDLVQRNLRSCSPEHTRAR